MRFFGAMKRKITMTEKQVLLSTTYFGPVQWYQKLYRYDRVFIERCDTFRKQTYRNRCVIATTNGMQALTVPVERADGAQQMRDIRISDHGNWRHVHWHALLSAYSESPFFDYYADDIRPFFERKWNFLYDYNMEICQKMCELLDIRPNILPTDQYIHTEDLPSFYSKTSVQDAKSTGFNGNRGYDLGSEYDIFNDTSDSVSNVEDNGYNVEYNVSADANSSVSTIENTVPNVTIADFRDAIDPKHPLEDPDFVPKNYYQVYAGKHGFLPNLSVLDLLFNMGPEGIFYL